MIQETHTHKHFLVFNDIYLFSSIMYYPEKREKGKGDKFTTICRGRDKDGGYNTTTKVGYR